MSKVLPLLLFIFFFNNSFCQTGGNNTYEFLNLASSARIAALGGNVISVKDHDLNLAFQNPALLSNEMNNQLAFNYIAYFADIKYGYVAYARDFPSTGTFSAGIHYVDYGEFIKADPNGTRDGSFGAKEYSFNLAYAKPVYKNLTSGITFKTIYSSLEEFTSVGIAADLGLTYYNEERLTGISLVIKNIGTQLSTYTSGNREPLPFEVQLGLSYKFAKAPLRFTLIATHLERPDLSYLTPDEGETDPITGEAITNNISFFEKIGRHLIAGAEILISKNFNLRAGYNYMRRKDLGIDTRMSITGFSGGFGFRISKFHFSYGRAAYHLAGGSNHFSVTTNVDDFFKKKSVSPAGE